MNKGQLTGQVSPEQIDKWKNETKQKFGENHKVYAYNVDGRICYLRSVDRDTYAVATTKISTSPAKFTEKVIEQIWLGGDETIRKDDSLYFGLADFVEELMGKKKGELGEL